MQGCGPGESPSISFVQPGRVTQMLGPGLHRPEFRPAIRLGYILVEPPTRGACAQADLAYLPHGGEKDGSVGQVYAVVHCFQHPAGPVVEHIREHRGRDGLVKLAAR